MSLKDRLAERDNRVAPKPEPANKKRVWPPPSRLPKHRDPDGERLHCLTCQAVIGQAGPEGAIIVETHYAPCGLPCISSETVPLENGVHGFNTEQCPRCQIRPCPLCQGSGGRFVRGDCTRCDGFGAVSGLELWLAEQEESDAR